MIAAVGRAERLGALWGAALLACGCAPRPQAPAEPPRQALPAAGISLPLLPGWEAEPTGDDPQVIFRLRRPMPAAGAPRLEVLVAPPRGTPGQALTPQAALASFVRRNLEDLHAQQRARAIAITYEDRRTVQVDTLEVVRLRHDYVLQAGERPAISQVSYLFLNNYQEVTLTAFGRSEVFGPVSDDIEEILHGMRSLYTGQPAPVEQRRSALVAFLRPRPLPARGALDARSGATYKPGRGLLIKAPRLPP